MANPIRVFFDSLKDKFSGAQAAEAAKAAPGPESPVPGASRQSKEPPEQISMGHVWVPDPNAIKLSVNPMILPFGETRNYASLEETLESPLAQSLFEIGGIEAVTLESAAVTVYMTEDSDWDAIMQKVPEVIHEHMSSGLLAVDGLDPSPPAPEKTYNFGFRQVEGSRPREEQIELVQRLLEEEINPAVAAHGGFFQLIDVQDDKVYVQLGGGCQGCGMVDVTLRQGVESRMREVMPELVALVDTTDHDSGTNPYYQPGK